MNLRKLRERTGLNQAEFWSRIGLSQSGGSRLENENREISEPIRRLLMIAYGDSAEYNRTLKQVRQ
jgi:transcriptional regulator with XRE-family HTH domain